MTAETEFLTKTVSGVEVVVVPSSVTWAGCAHCPFVVDGLGCSAERGNGRCEPGTYYADPQKFAIARLKGLV